MFDNYKYSLPLILSLLIFCYSDSLSQFSMSAKLENYFDDNIYNNYSKVSDFVNSFSLGSSYDFESDNNNLQFYYMGNLSYFKDNIFKSSNSHRVGVVNTYLFSENGNPLNLGLNFNLRNNRDNFSIYDYNAFSAYGNYRQAIGENAFLLLGYLFNRNSIKDFSIFSYNEHKGFIKFSQAFPSGTSLFLGVEFDNKNYTEQYSTPESTNNTSQLSGQINLSQLLSNVTELSAYFVKRFSITKGTRYISTDEFIFYEEEIFNDIYSYDGFETGISFAQMISDNFMLNVQGAYNRKNFLNLPVADLQGYSQSSLRIDNQYAVGAELKIDLSFITENLIGSFKWNYIKNNSNDLYYEYDNQLFSTTFEWGM